MDSYSGKLHKKLVEQVSEEIEKQKDHLASGTAEDFAEYKARCGRIRGLTDALNIAEKIAKDMEKE